MIDVFELGNTLGNEIIDTTYKFYVSTVQSFTSLIYDNI